MEQIILENNNNYQQLDNYLHKNKIKRIFVVTLNDINTLNIGKHLKEINDIEISYFTNFKPNPDYESVVTGIKEFKQTNSELIIAIGGGSAMDVAKCIKLYANMDDKKNYLEQAIISNDIPLMAIPTTAGTGSEATKYAVIYYQGEKQSITDISIIPTIVLFDPTTLETLPTYQKKATMLDALSHSIESMWSVNSNEESIKYAGEALTLIISNYKNYLENNQISYINMLRAANLAGKAINITQTTAGHAMCYKITSLCNIAHGHAAAIVNAELIPYMLDNLSKCIDTRGPSHLKMIFEKLSTIIGSDIRYFLNTLLLDLALYDVPSNSYDINLLVKSVNTTRLKNHPIKLEETDIRLLYERILDKIKKGN